MAEPMSDVVKARLKELTQRRRNQKRLLKDLDGADLQVLCDYVQERDGDPTLPLSPSGELAGGYYVAFLKYAIPQQVEALAARIPSTRVTYTEPGPHRQQVERVCFALNFLREVLKAGVHVPGQPHYHERYVRRVYIDAKGNVRLG